MVKDGMLELYVGGDTFNKAHFDADRFGYFNLVDEIQQLGYNQWSRVAFKVPRSMVMVDIKDDKDVMNMLSHLEFRISILHVYIVGGTQRQLLVSQPAMGDEKLSENLGFQEVEGSKRDNQNESETEVEGDNQEDGESEKEGEDESDRGSQKDGWG
ncbi:hypothetical protein AAHA92_31415 [Salvia divinorum]|uniref:PB1-like domain-containing protein n=1 Tax=Salvia divinorum TaxID=28513 RepID=A0ABD1FQ80_SALDI